LFTISFFIPSALDIYKLKNKYSRKKCIYRPEGREEWKDGMDVKVAIVMIVVMVMMVVIVMMVMIVVIVMIVVGCRIDPHQSHSKKTQMGYTTIY
jgi:hypothetical protein